MPSLGFVASVLVVLYLPQIRGGCCEGSGENDPFFCHSLSNVEQDQLTAIYGQDCLISTEDKERILYSVLGQEDVDPTAEVLSAEKRKPNYMRFGKRKPNYMRFGKRKPNYMRFGKRKPNYMRFGKRKPNYMRFGRSVAEPEMEKRKPNYMRFGRKKREVIQQEMEKRKPNYMRFGKREDIDWDQQ